MAEIKSTLELVMERTRHLTLSEDEKREQALAEFKKSLSGLLQRFQDGALTLDHFREDLRRLRESLQVTGGGVVFDEIVKRLNLDGDNAWAFELLAGAVGTGSEGIAAVCGEYRETLVKMAGNRIEEIRKSLQKRRGISGTAVIPNLAADPDWTADQQRLHDQFELILRRELGKLKPALQT
jgi:hypothetical protein